MTWVKICGITNREDAAAAVEAGADALGFVFYNKSPRNVEIETVREIVGALPEHVEKVGVLVDADSERIRQVIAETGLTAVQLHGKRAVGSAVQSARVPKVIPVLGGNSLKGEVLLTLPAYQGIFALLLDAQTNGVVGGSGATFDWEASREMVQMISLQIPVIVAGGLTSSNVSEAIKLFHPFGVDVSSGVEARPGKKDPAKIRAFVQAVRHANQNS